MYHVLLVNPIENIEELDGVCCQLWVKSSGKNKRRKFSFSINVRLCLLQITLIEKKNSTPILLSYNLTFQQIIASMIVKKAVEGSKKHI